MVGYVQFKKRRPSNYCLLCWWKPLATCAGDWDIVTAMNKLQPLLPAAGTKAQVTYVPWPVDCSFWCFPSHIPAKSAAQARTVMKLCPD